MITEMKPLHRLATGSLIVALAIVGVIALDQQAPASTLDTSEQWQALTPHPLQHSIGLVGVIEPETSLALTAPFDGNIQASLVQVGQQVEPGQLLLTMDSTAIEMQVRDALSAQLKARRAVQDMQDWDTGPLISRARRSVSIAEMALGNVQRKLKESESLFDRGIIARNELEDLQQQARQLALDVTAARLELEQVEQQGKGEYRQIADMELANATVKYEALRDLLQAKEVRAPFSGIVIPVVQDGSNASSPEETLGALLQAGSRISQGQVLFGLANIERLRIVTKVSELDINRLHPGQAVEITGDGFAGERLDGSVSVVSSLALPNDGQGSAQFPVTLAISTLTPKQLERVRLGMSARLNIVTYSNEKALIVPATAISSREDGQSVMYRGAMDMPIERAHVTVGQATQEGVEVFGLKPGFVRVNGE